MWDDGVLASQNNRKRAVEYGQYGNIMRTARIEPARRNEGQRVSKRMDEEEKLNAEENA